MHTTIDINAALLERVKRYAACQGKRVGDVVSDALLEKLGREEKAPPIASKPFQFLTYGSGGVQSGIDLSSNANLEEAMDEEFRDPNTGKIDLHKMR